MYCLGAVHGGPRRSHLVFRVVVGFQSFQARVFNLQRKTRGQIDHEKVGEKKVASRRQKWSDNFGVMSCTNYRYVLYVCALVSSALNAAAAGCWRWSVSVDRTPAGLPNTHFALSHTIWPSRSETAAFLIFLRTHMACCKYEGALPLFTSLVSVYQVCTTKLSRRLLVIIPGTYVVCFCCDYRVPGRY